MHSMYYNDCLKFVQIINWNDGIAGRIKISYLYDGSQSGAQLTMIEDDESVKYIVKKHEIEYYFCCTNVGSTNHLFIYLHYHINPTVRNMRAVTLCILIENLF